MLRYKNKVNLNAQRFRVFKAGSGQRMIVDNDAEREDYGNQTVCVVATIYAARLCRVMNTLQEYFPLAPAKKAKKAKATKPPNDDRPTTSPCG